jgi:phosphoketolase
LDQEDPQVCKVPLVLKDFKDLWENQEILDLLVLQVQMEQEVCLDYLVRMVKVVEMVKLDLKEDKVHLEKEAFLECQVFQDQKDIVAFLG